MLFCFYKVPEHFFHINCYTNRNHTIFEKSYDIGPMKGIATEELIAKLKAITLENKTLVLKKCLHLGENQMSWKPNKYTWNISEVLAHMNELANYYNPYFIKKIDTAKDKHLEVQEYFVSSPLGRSAWKSMKLGKVGNIKRKFKSPKNQNPTINPELITGNEIETFISNQEALLEILDSALTVSLKKIKMAISISKAVRLRLGDVLMFVIYHNERHIQQIKNLLENPKFPKKLTPRND